MDADLVELTAVAVVIAALGLRVLPVTRRWAPRGRLGSTRPRPGPPPGSVSTVARTPAEHEVEELTQLDLGL